MGLSLVIRNGVVYDGLGSAGERLDIGIEGDRIAVIGSIPEGMDAEVIDATGLAVSPGFINVLSHAWGSLQQDGGGASDVLQGVTTEIFGEALSLGPSNEAFTAFATEFGAPDDVRFDFPRLADGLSHLEKSGVTMNVASLIGGHNLRILGAGMDPRRLTAAELSHLQGVVAEEMQDGALGIGTALIYAPGNYADTDELVAVCKPVGEHDGLYVSHMRSEGDQFLECLEELLEIGTRAECRTEVYHLKAAGTHNHHKMALAIARIQAARDAGQPVSADMYPYTAGGTALAASIPPRYHAGGAQALLERIKDPRQRAEIRAALGQHSDEFENLFLGSGSGEGILLGTDLADGTPAAGKRLPEVAALMGIGDPAEALLTIVEQNPSMGAIYFMMSEENVQLGLSQPWVSIGSDATSGAVSGSDRMLATHPRTYGTFARVLGHYSRDVGLFPLEEAIRKMTSQPAEVWRIKDRGVIREGAYADLALFDAATVIDTATYEHSHSHALGMHHVITNGQLVVRDGALTSARPGRALQRNR